MTLEEYLDGLSPLQQAIASDLRHLVQHHFPDLVPSIKYHVPFYVYRGPIAYYCTYAKQKTQGLYLGFCRGNMLRDPLGLLTGEGNTIKKLYLNQQDDLKELWPAISQFLIESMMINDLKKGKETGKN